MSACVSTFSRFPRSLCLAYQCRAFISIDRALRPRVRFWLQFRWSDWARSRSGSQVVRRPDEICGVVTLIRSGWLALWRGGLGHVDQDRQSIVLMSLAAPALISPEWRSGGLVSPAADEVMFQAEVQKAQRWSGVDIGEQNR